MKLEVITPDKTIFDGEIASVKVPGSNGSFTVLLNHAPIISTLEAGEIKIVTSDMKEELVQVTGGIIEVQRNNIIVLADLVKTS